MRNWCATTSARIYPELAETPLAYAWGGTLAITLQRLPYIRRVRPGVYAAAGYSGQGVAIAPFAGKILAEAIAGNTAKLDTFAALPVSGIPGRAPPGASRRWSLP